MLSCVEHEKRFITFGHDFQLNIEATSLEKQITCIFDDN